MYSVHNDKGHPLSGLILPRNKPDFESYKTGRVVGNKDGIMST
jgi:hypothetical protein